MKCPICKQTLDKSILHDVEVDFCPTCLGLWFEEDELRLAKDIKDRDLRWLDIDLWKDPKEFKVSPTEAKTPVGKSLQKLCPTCRLPLYEVGYGDSDIKVDVCNVCRGIWLDRGEFKKITEYLKEKAGSELLENYAKNLVEEFWEVFTGPEKLREEILDLLVILKLLNYKFVTQHPVISQLILQLPK